MNSCRRFTFVFLLLITVTHIARAGLNPIRIVLVVENNAAARVAFGVEKLSEALQQHGYIVVKAKAGQKIRDRIIQITLASSGKKESFAIKTDGKGKLVISGADASGILYGCLELADRIRAQGTLPDTINFTDAPEMVLRGACIGIQKPYYLPGRTVYEYPYTPETFPWLYDKEHWVRYLDTLVTNRMNSLYLWNGHPFASLVRLKDYPYAVEVDDATFRKNEEMYKFLTTEADKRGIWVIQMFYNIIVSKPFAEKNNMKTQERERPIIPIIADYTRKSIAAFVEKYPNVGLMVCLGEAMEGVGHDDIEWFTKTIIPGVKDGLAALGKTEEPPIVLRAHDTDAPAVMRASLPLYKNLYTEAKFNGEALTTPEPRGQWAALHRELSGLGSVQIENIHILANLEPFRYGSADFIQRSVIGMHDSMGGNGLHLYPQASYWDWPYSADSVKGGKRLLQIERDWIWYRAWSRYAWQARRDRKEEINYWSGLLAARYGCAPANGQQILEAYEQSGEIAPKLLRRFGITDGNRQTLTLGMLMTQLINPFRYGLFTLLYDSESPEGEMLIQYAEKEWKKEKHIGETPVQIIAEVKEHARKAVAAAEAAASGITQNKEEFERLKNDMYCYQALAFHFAYKAEAALSVLRYKYSNDVKDLERALPLLEKSVDYYRELAKLTSSSYLYANSMQTQQRKIPIRGTDGKMKTWTEVLVPFEAELTHFRHAVDSLKNKPATGVKIVEVRPATVKLADAGLKRFKLAAGQSAFSDTVALTGKFTPELARMEGVQLNWQKQIEQGTQLTFTTDKPVKVLVGYFKKRQAAFSGPSVYLKAPELETNASANDYGQADIRIANALVVKGQPPVNIHTYSFPAGTHTLKLAKGVCMIVGFAEGTSEVPVFDAGLTENGSSREIDWLFE